MVLSFPGPLQQLAGYRQTYRNLQNEKAQALRGRCEISSMHYWDRNESRGREREGEIEELSAS